MSDKKITQPKSQTKTSFHIHFLDAQLPVSTSFLLTLLLRECINLSQLTIQRASLCSMYFSPKGNTKDVALNIFKIYQRFAN